MQMFNFMMSTFQTVLFLVCVPLKAAKKPNFVIFMADDLGIGDVSCFGNSTLQTPNIDLLCQHGVKLEHNISPESICTPSRGAFLTGRYALRLGLGMKSNGRARVITSNSGNGGLKVSETTFATLLRQEGYQTALIGKWHLGLSCDKKPGFCHHPLKHGFDYFYGIPLSNLRDCQPDNYKTNFTFLVSRELCIILMSTSLLLLILAQFQSGDTHSLLSILVILGISFSTGHLVYLWFFKADVCMVMRNFTVVEQPIFSRDLTQRFATDAVGFIQKSIQEKPFLLFFSLPDVHTSHLTSDFFNGRSMHGPYGDNVEEMDWAVGVVLSALKKEGLLNDTLVYFLSDHGPDLEEYNENGEFEGGSKGSFKGGKSTSWEGGIRVPTVVMWRNVFPEGTIIKQPTSSMDVFATITALAGARIPESRYIDGKNIFDLLSGNTNVTPHDCIFHYCGEALHAVTFIEKQVNFGVWKVHFATPVFHNNTEFCGDGFGGAVCPCFGTKVKYHNPPLVFSLNQDPNENYPLNTEDNVVKGILSNIDIAIANHKQTIVFHENQLTKDKNSMQISRIVCCNFPFCSCQEKYLGPLLAMNNTKIDLN